MEDKLRGLLQVRQATDGSGCERCRAHATCANHARTRARVRPRTCACAHSRKRTCTRIHLKPHRCTANFGNLVGLETMDTSHGAAGAQRRAASSADPIRVIPLGPMDTGRLHTCRLPLQQWAMLLGPSAIACRNTRIAVQHVAHTLRQTSSRLQHMLQQVVTHVATGCNTGCNTRSNRLQPTLPRVALCAAATRSHI